MSYNIGQKFVGEYPPEAALWCNKNNHRIVQLESIDGVKQFQIQEIPSPSLEEVKTQKITSLKNERDKREEAPVEYKEKLWDFDTKSRDRINAAATALEIGGVDTITWTAFDDTSLELTVTDLKTIVAIAAIRGDALHTKYRELRDAVNVAETIEEINSIIWE